MGAGTICLSILVFYLFIFSTGQRGTTKVVTKGAIEIIDELLPQNSTLKERDPKTIETIVLHSTELPTLVEARQAAETTHASGNSAGGR